MAKMYPFPFLSYSAPMRGPEHSQVRPVASMRIASLSRTHALRFCALPGEEASKVEELAPATFSLHATHRRSADFRRWTNEPPLMLLLSHACIACAGRSREGGYSSAAMN
jgi:hypothetical protein